MRDGAKLWKYLEPLAPAILTGAPVGRSDWAAPQKRQWCEKKLHLSADRVLVVDACDKPFFSHPGAILVDDRKEYREGWEARGGIFVHYTDAMASIEGVRHALQRFCCSGALPPVWPRMAEATLNLKRPLADEAHEESTCPLVVI